MENIPQKKIEVHWKGHFKVARWLKEYIGIDVTREARFGEVREMPDEAEEDQNRWWRICRPWQNEDCLTSSYLIMKPPKSWFSSHKTMLCVFCSVHLENSSWRYLHDWILTLLGLCSNVPADNQMPSIPREMLAPNRQASCLYPLTLF